MVQIYYSNRAELLFLRLKQALFTPPVLPFAKRLIIVPSQSMKSWLLLQMANDPDLNIATGLEISNLDNTLNHLRKSCGKIETFLSPLELGLMLESKIRSIIASWDLLSDEERALWEPLKAYLKFETAILPRKTQRRITSLCQELSACFLEYGIYAGKMISKWKEADGWQQKLWFSIFEEESQKHFPYRDFTELSQESTLQLHHKDLQVHVFAQSFLPRIYHNFLMQLSKSIPVNFYMLSPCQVFWSDILSRRESQKLQSYWQKRGISPAQQIALAEYLRDCNPLLANFGRLGREMAQQLEESNALSNEDYVLPKSALKQPIYEELISDEILIDDTEKELTLLEGLQTDLALLRNPERSEKVLLSKNDNSLQIHAATSRSREIQVLYDTLLGIIDKHAKEDSPIYPGEIIVMAPNISEYAPFIRAVFKSSDSLIDAQIMDLSAPSQNPFIQGFLHLISLPLTRWDVSAILKLLDYSDFQRKQGFRNEDVGTVRDWIKASEVRWGEDASHRDELLKRDHCLNGMVENSSIGTWENAIGRLLTGLCMNQETALLNPLDQLDATQGPLLGKWISILRSLRSDLQILNDNREMNLVEWSHYLRCLCETYFSAEDDGLQQSLYNHFEAFCKVEGKLKEDRFPFSTIRFHLQASLNQCGTQQKEQSLNAIRFCSLLPMRAIPSKVIAMIGMEDGVFPKSNSLTSLNLMRGCKETDYCPSQTDYDRFLFLETVLSARNYLILSYNGYSESDGKEQPPSLLISELINYIDKAYLFEDKLPSQHCLYKHPHYPFDHKYFSEDNRIRSYSYKQYLAARAYYHVDKPSINGFLSKFVVSHPIQWQDNSHTVRINLKELAQLAKNPIKTYFNRTLGMFLENPENRKVKNEESFHLSHLQNHILKHNSLNQPIDHILNKAERSGQLPVGAFKTVYVDKIRNEIAALQRNLEELGVLPQEIFKITFSENAPHANSIDPDHWHLPHLQIPYRGKIIHIVGTFPEVSKKGLITYDKDDKTDVLEWWPHFLVLHCLIKAHSLPIEPQLLLLQGKKGKAKSAFSDDPFPLLEQYLDYYFTSQENASPLIPKWIPHLVSEDADSFADKMHQTLTNPHQPIYDEYLKWSMQDGSALPDSPTLVAHWQNNAQKLFSGLLQNWYPSKASKGNAEFDYEIL